MRFTHAHQQPRQLCCVPHAVADQIGMRNSCCSHAIADICPAPVRQVDWRSSPKCSCRGEVLLPCRILPRALLRCASGAILTPCFLSRRADIVAWRLLFYGVEHGGAAAALAAQAARDAANGGPTAASKLISRPIHVQAPSTLAACSSARQIDACPVWIGFE